MIIDKIMYNDISKSTKTRFTLNNDFKNNITKRKIKKALSNINSLMEKHSIYEEGVLNDLLYYLALAIVNCDFTDIQKERLEMWFDGYTESDIAKKYNINRWVVSKSINSACEKIVCYLRDEVK